MRSRSTDPKSTTSDLAKDSTPRHMLVAILEERMSPTTSM